MWQLRDSPEPCGTFHRDITIVLSDWRFEFLREHVVEFEVYLLGKADLEFAELLSEEEDDFMPCYIYRR